MHANRLFPSSGYDETMRMFNYPEGKLYVDGMAFFSKRKPNKSGKRTRSGSI